MSGGLYNFYEKFNFLLMPLMSCLAVPFYSFRVRKSLRPNVGDVDAAAVACGFGRTIGNKVSLQAMFPFLFSVNDTCSNYTYADHVILLNIVLTVKIMRITWGNNDSSK